MPLPAELARRAAAAGIPVVLEAPEAPSPRLLLGGAALLLDERSSVAEVLVTSLPDRSLLERLEGELGRPVLISLAAPEVLEKVRAGDALVDRLLLAAESSAADAVLVVPGRSALALLASGERRGLSDGEMVPDDWQCGLRTSPSGGRWRLARRSSSLLVARRLLPRLPDAAELRLPAALLEAADRGSGRFALVGGFGSGRTLTLYALLARCLERPGRHALLVTDGEMEYSAHRHGSLLEHLRSPDCRPYDLSRPPVPDVLAIDTADPMTLPESFASPVVLISSTVPVPGFATVPVRRSSDGVAVGLPELG